MFGWFKKWFGSEERYDVYKPKERKIFEYWDGSKMIHADPLVLYCKMMEHRPDLVIDAKVAASEWEKEAPGAHMRLCDRIREIFSVKNLEQGGLTNGEALELFDSFIIYTEWVKKNFKPLVTSSNNTEDSKFSSKKDQDILNSSDSGSIEKGVSIEEREPSPMASA